MRLIPKDHRAAPHMPQHCHVLIAVARPLCPTAAPASTIGLMRRFATLATMALAATLLAGCGAGGTPDIGYTGDDGTQSLPQTEYSDELSSEGMSQDSGGGSLVEEEHVITTGQVYVTADDPAAALATLTEKVASLGGSVASSQKWTSGDSPYAEATVRVPASEFQGVLDWLPEVGTVDSQSTQTENVTTQITDLNARIEALNTSVARLTELMATAENTADLLAAEEMLTQRQAELDSLTSTLEYLSDLVSMSTLTVTFSTISKTPGPSISWGEAWNNFVSSLFWLLNALVFVLPWALLLTVIVMVWRLVRRRKKSRAIRSGHVTDPTSD